MRGGCVCSEPLLQCVTRYCSYVAQLEATIELMKKTDYKPGILSALTHANALPLRRHHRDRTSREIDQARLPGEQQRGRGRRRRQCSRGCIASGSSSRSPLFVSNASCDASQLASAAASSNAVAGQRRFVFLFLCNLNLFELRALDSQGAAGGCFGTSSRTGGGE